MGAQVVLVHYGGDARGEDPEADDTLAVLPRVKAAVDVPVGVVTFDPEGGEAAVAAGADIVLIGHPYLLGPRAEADADRVRSPREGRPRLNAATHHHEGGDR